MQTTERPGDEVRSAGLTRALFLVLLAMLYSTLPRLAHPQTLADPSTQQGTFILTVQDGLISLGAKGAPLKAVFEEISHRMEIPIKVEIPAAAKVTLAFERLPLPEALKHFGKYINYGYVERWEQGALRISSITVHSLKIQPLPIQAGADASQEVRPRKALEIEIDPRQFLQQKRQ